MSDLDLNAMEVRAIIVEKNLAVSALGSLAHQVATDAIAAYAEVRRQMLGFKLKLWAVGVSEQARSNEALRRAPESSTSPRRGARVALIWQPRCRRRS